MEEHQPPAAPAGPLGLAGHGVHGPFGAHDTQEHVAPGEGLAAHDDAFVRAVALHPSMIGWGTCPN